LHWRRVHIILEHEFPILVEIYLDAENDVKNNNFTEAFKKYESILFDEPGNAATHNSLGWIYKTQMDNYEKGENHYLAAIKSQPGYPYAYSMQSFLWTRKGLPIWKSLLQEH
jgi:hypothetical protein